MAEALPSAKTDAIICSSASRLQFLQDCLESLRDCRPQPRRVILVNTRDGRIAVSRETFPGSRDRALFRGLQSCPGHE